MDINAAVLVVGVLLPLIVGFVTKASWSSAVKAWFLAVASAVSGFVAEFQVGGDSFDWKAAAVNALVVFIAGVATHYGFWKPVGATGVAQASLVKD